MSEHHSETQKGQVGSPPPKTRRPIRVLHVVSSLDVGGQERVILDLTRHASPGLIDPAVVPLAAGGHMLESFERANISVLELPDHRSGITRRVRALRKLAQRWSPDILHCHNPAPIVAGALARLAGVRAAVVGTRHGRNEMTTRRHQLVYDWAMRRLDVVVAVSADSGLHVRRLTGLDASRVRVIHNGIDTRAYGPPMEQRQAQFAAIVVCRLDPQKGLTHLLDAVPLILRRHPTFHLRIVGDGPERGALESQVKTLQIAHAVSFLGVRNDVADLLRNASAFVLPSLSEGISISILEAMSSGLPVIATRVGGNPEIIAGGTTGTLVEPGDVQGLAEALCATIENPAAAAVRGAMARQHAVLHFDVSRMIEAYENLYLDLMTRPRGRQR